MKTKIYSVFPACGKTWLYEHQHDYGVTILDSDSSEFSWIRTGESKVRNPDFPSNYIQYIKENIGRYDYIFVSSHAAVRELLDAESIDFTIVYPEPSLKAEWVGRCYIRDRNGEEGCNPDVLYENWDQWVGECIETANTHPQIVLSEGEHLSDYLVVEYITQMADPLEWYQRGWVCAMCGCDFAINTLKGGAVDARFCPLCGQPRWGRQ